MIKKEIADFLFSNFDLSESLDETFFENLGRWEYNLESTLTTPKGRWEIYTRENSSSILNNVLALYYRGDNPMNLFIGKTEVGNAEEDALTISRNILEHQIPLRWLRGGLGAALIGIPLCVAAIGATLLGVVKLPEEEMRILTQYIMCLWYPLLPPAMATGYIVDYIRTRSLSDDALNYHYAHYAISLLKTDDGLLENV